ncbi:MAG: NADAR family protein [Gammaproteobacteria bacterium]|nr:NADAR family protein [Gammaproteobacteria bacterium]MDH5652008.1 NADAR family protein [Gammaproteobacteria bacterium]
MQSLFSSKDDLLDYLEQGNRVKYLFFWGHTPKQSGVVDQSCLSQWFPAEFVINGTSYPTAEHYMMAEKARLFSDQVAQKKILAASHPGDAKKLGRTVCGYTEQKWLSHRFDIVLRGNIEKFHQNPELGDFLLKTGDRVLVEASPVDKIWGIGLEKTHGNANNPAKWPGLNLLGFALMAVRQGLRK